MRKWIIWTLFFVVLVETFILVAFSILVLTKKQKKETLEVRLDSKPSNPTSTPLPTVTPTPTPSPITFKPLIKKVQAQTISVYISDINDYRISNGLSALSEDPLSCSFANTRANEIALNFSHEGFSNRTSSHTLPYKNYSTVVENIAQGHNRAGVVSLWINSAPHAQNLKADISYGCVGEYGDYFAFEGWKP